MSDPKELDFFSLHWERGLDWYRTRFALHPAVRAVGDVSPSYAKAHLHPRTAERIAATLPEVKVVYLLRDPIERLRSEYLDERAAGVEHRPIEEALRDAPRYLGTSRYAFQLDHLCAHIARDRMLIVLSEDLRHRRAATLQRIHDFIGVEHHVPPSVTRELNRTAAKDERRDWPARPVVRRLARHVPAGLRRAIRPLAVTPTAQIADLSPGLRAHLSAELADDVARLRSYLGHDFHGWGIA